MGSFITKAIEGMGYFGLVLLMFVENVFPPIPSELIMPLAGYLASQDKLALWGVIVAGTAGSVLGAIPLYKVGEKIGEQRLKKWSAAHGRWLAFSPEDVDRAQGWFQRHGKTAVFLCRLVPGIRSLISIPAGIAKMPMGQFLVATTLGSAIWTAILASIGYYLGANFEQVEKYLDPVSTAVIAIIVAMYLWRVVTHKGEAGA